MGVVCLFLTKYPLRLFGFINSNLSKYKQYQHEHIKKPYCESKVSLLLNLKGRALYPVNRDDRKAFRFLCLHSRVQSLTQLLRRRVYLKRNSQIKN